jgi:hypothetical protein
MQLQLRLIGQIPGVQREVRTELGQSLRYDNPELAGPNNRHTGCRWPHHMARRHRHLQLLVSRQPVYQAMWQEVASATLQFLLGFFGLALLLWWLFNRRLVKPLQDMAHTVRNYQPGKPLPCCPVHPTRWWIMS